MGEFSKKTGKLIREWAAIAHEREMARELGKLEEKFAAWRRGEMETWDLNEAIHEHLNRTARELFGRYNYERTPLYGVIYAINFGVLAPDEAPELRQEFASLIQTPRRTRDEALD